MGVSKAAGVDQALVSFAVVDFERQELGAGATAFTQRLDHDHDFTNLAKLDLGVEDSPSIHRFLPICLGALAPFVWRRRIVNLTEFWTEDLLWQGLLLEDPKRLGRPRTLHV